MWTDSARVADRLTAVRRASDFSHRDVQA
jgi:hypothetical protein